MRINSKTLALLAAATIGTGLVACQRSDENRSASNQETAPMNQAPRQGYTGPANPSTSAPPSAPLSTPGGPTDSYGGAPSGSQGSDQTGSPGNTNPTESQQQQDRDQQR